MSTSVLRPGRELKVGESYVLSKERQTFLQKSAGETAYMPYKHRARVEVTEGELKGLEGRLYKGMRIESTRFVFTQGSEIKFYFPFANVKDNPIVTKFEFVIIEMTKIGLG